MFKLNFRLNSTGQNQYMQRSTDQVLPPAYRFRQLGNGERCFSFIYCDASEFLAKCKEQRETQYSRPQQHWSKFSNRKVLNPTFANLFL